MLLYMQLEEAFGPVHRPSTLSFWKFLSLLQAFARQVGMLGRSSFEGGGYDSVV
jgi:hypothetical protein